MLYATTVFRARGCIRLLRIRDLRYGRTLSGSKNLKSGRKKHPSPSTTQQQQQPRPQPQRRPTFLIAAAAASINLLLLLGICHLGSYNNIFLANYVYTMKDPIPFFAYYMNVAAQRAEKCKNVQAKKLVKSNKSKIFFREIAFLAVLNFFPVQKSIFGHF